MSEQVIVSGTMQVPIYAVDADLLAGTASYVAVPGSSIDARAWRSVAYTAAITDNAMDIQYLGAMAADFSDEVVVETDTNVAAAGVGTYSTDFATYNFYRVKVKNNGGSTGNAKIRGAAKR